MKQTSPRTTLSMLRSAAGGRFFSAVGLVCGGGLVSRACEGRAVPRREEEEPFSFGPWGGGSTALVNVVGGAVPLDISASPVLRRLFGPPSGFAAHFSVVWVYLGPDDAPRSLVAPVPLDVAVPLVCLLAVIVGASAACAACFPRRVFGALGRSEANVGAAGLFAGSARGAGFGV